MLVPLFLFSCEYTPIYSNKNDYNFSIEKINFEGNSEINNLVEKKLIKFQNRNVNKKFIITTISSYKKISQMVRSQSFTIINKCKTPCLKNIFVANINLINLIVL